MNKTKLLTAIVFALSLSNVAMAQVSNGAAALNDTNANSNSTALSGSTSGVLSNNGALAGSGNLNNGSISAGSASGAAANGYNNGQDQGQAQQQAQGVSLGGGGAGSGIANDNSTYINNTKGSDLSNAVGIATAPALTTTLTETCMGSTSMGGGFSGGSFSFGTTWRDHACVRRLDAREIRSYGDIQAAKEIMCDSDLVREAFKRVGRPCVADGGSYVAVSQAAPEPVVEAPAVEPVAVDTKVKDDFDSSAQDSAKILKKADDAREAMKTKYGW